MTRVVVSGAGIVTPLADAPAELHERLCDGCLRPGHIPVLTAAGLPCDLGAVIAPDALRRVLADRPCSGIDKVGQLAIVGARRALMDAALDEAPPSDLGLVLGTMFSGAHTISQFDRRAQTAGPSLASPLEFANTVLNAAAGQTAIRLSLRGINTTISGGHTSGLHALEYAADLTGQQRVTTLIAGGVEELSLEAHLGFCRAGLTCGTNGRPGHVPVPFDDRRTGFALGEAAGFVVLESAASARRRGVPVYAELAGFCSTNDPDAITRGFCDAGTIVEAISGALYRAGATAADVDAISAAANGSYAGDREEAKAIAAVFGRCERAPAVTAIKGALGEMLGASGPIQVIAMCAAMKDGRLPGIVGLRDLDGCEIRQSLRAEPCQVAIRTALVLAVSPEGGCCAVVLRAPGAAR